MTERKGRMGSLPHLWALSDSEINNYFKNEKLYLGTYAKDEIPMALAKRKRGAMIINMGDINTGGTHWVAILMGTNTIYFDSFGCEPPQQVVAFMKKRNKPSFYTDRQLQDLKASSCGWYCIFMAEQCIIRGRDIMDILPLFTFNPIENERSLSAFWKKAMAKTPT